MADQLCTHKVQLLRCDNDVLSSLYQNQWNIFWVFNFFWAVNRRKQAQMCTDKFKCEVLVFENDT